SLSACSNIRDLVALHVDTLLINDRTFLAYLDFVSLDVNRCDGINGNVLGQTNLDIRTSTVGTLCLGDNNVVTFNKAHGIAVMDWCGVAETRVITSGARTRATCARVAVTTSTCATVIATRVVRCRCFHIPVD